MDLPEYDSIALILLKANVLQSAAEIHGMMCALICAGSEVDLVDFLDAWLGSDFSQDEQNRERLQQLYEFSDTQLQNMQFDFELFLPDADDELSIRAEAFTHWAKGYVEGMRAASVDVEKSENEELRDAFTHITEFTELDFFDIHGSDKEEQLLMEIEEYLRMAVMLIYMECRGRTGSEDGPSRLH